MCSRPFRTFFIVLVFVGMSTVLSSLPTIAASRMTSEKYMPMQGHHTLTSATVINTNDPILLIHGASGSSSVDCNSYWSNTEQYLQGSHTVAGQQIHWTGPIIRIGYYIKDNNNCYDNLAKLIWPHCRGYNDQGLGTNKEPIQHLACELAWYIYSNYSYYGKNVEVVGHSMGGLIIRWALTCSTTSITKISPCTSQSNKNPFPNAKLLVRDVVNFDTPNGGIDPKLLDVGAFGYTLGGILGCTKKNGMWICPDEVVQMETGSSFMIDLNNNAQNPQGAQGTNWTLMGVTKGTACLSLPPQSTTFIDGGNKILYTYPCYSHITISALKDYAMMDDPPPTDTLDGIVNYCNNCPKSPTTWQSSSTYPHALLSTLYALTEQPIIESHSWHIVSSVSPVTHYNNLEAVTTISSANAWAVGEYDGGSSVQSLIEHWGGTSWTRQSSPNPGSVANIFKGVKALSATDVWAVGYYDNGNGAHSLILHTTDGGNTWTEDTADEANGVILFAIDGDPSSGDAWAVGEFKSVTSNFNAVTLHLANGHFSQQPNVSNNSGIQLSSVSERSSNDVWAVGNDFSSSPYGNPFTMHWESVNGTYQWVDKATPSYSSHMELSAVTDIGPNNAWAVGRSFNPGGVGALIHWDGSAWSATPLTVPVGSGGDLNAVAADASGNIWAAGYYCDSGSGCEFPLIWHSSDGGSNWQQETVEDPSDSGYKDFGYFNGIARGSTSQNTWAVGYILDRVSGVSNSLIEQYS